MIAHWLPTQVLIEDDSSVVLAHYGWLDTTLYRLIEVRHKKFGGSENTTSLWLTKLDPGGTHWKHIREDKYLKNEVARQTVINIIQCANPEDGYTLDLL